MQHPKPSLRHLSTITDEEMYNVCLLSGETIPSMPDFTCKIERVRDEDENIRYIDAHCRYTHGDGSQSYNVIVLSTNGMIQVIYKDRDGCDNICRRDVVVGQMAVLLYLRLKGFDFSEDLQAAMMMLKGREAWQEWYSKNQAIRLC